MCVCVCVCVFCGQILGLTDMLTQFSLTAVRPILTHRLILIHPLTQPSTHCKTYVSLCNVNFSSSPSPPLPHPQVLTPYTHPPTYIHTYLESTFPQVYIRFACIYTVYRWKKNGSVGRSTVQRQKKKRSRESWLQSKRGRRGWRRERKSSESCKRERKVCSAARLSCTACIDMGWWSTVNTDHISISCLRVSELFTGPAVFSIPMLCLTVLGYAEALNVHPMSPTVWPFSGFHVVCTLCKIASIASSPPLLAICINMRSQSMHLSHTVFTFAPQNGARRQLSRITSRPSTSRRRQT